MTYKHWLSAGVLLLAGLAVKAQEPSFPERVGQSFQNFFNNTPQEKLYVQLDKSNYTAGEQIWIKTYLADATYHLPGLFSKYVYIELTNRQDSLFKRIKLRRTDSCFSGNIALPVDIAPGDYCLRAFTSWMQNCNEDFFFKKNIRIINPANDVNIHTLNTLNGSTVTTTITLVGNSGKPYAGGRFKAILRKGETEVRKTTVRSDETGNIIFEHTLADSVNNIQLSFSYDLPFRYSTTVYLPSMSPDFDLQFFPEGGNLLSGTVQTVAFKAIDANGHSIRVEGTIYDQQNKAAGTFKTTHRGMGTLNLPTQPGKQYYALAKSEKGTEKKVILPALSDNGFALNIAPGRDSSVFLSVKKGASADTTRQLYIIIHTRGRLISVVPADINFIGELKPAQFPAGVTHFVLTDDSHNIYSERLYFMRQPNTPQLALTTDKEQYDRREKVTLKLCTKNSAGLPETGNFSVSVTDNNTAIRDTLADNIISYFLLHSDLRGNIEAPGTYLKEPEANIDLLMLTHGWTRFDISKLLKGASGKPEYALELQQSLQGIITNYGEKAMPNGTIQVFIPSLGILGGVKADARGKFTIRDIEFPDSTLILLRGYKAQGGKYVDIHMTEPDYKQIHSFFPGITAEKQTTRNEFLDSFKDGYYIRDGVKVYMLEEVNIVRHQPRKEISTAIGEYTDMADQLLTREQLSKISASNIFQLIMRLPGVFVSGEQVTVRGSGNLMFMVDGIPVESAFIQAISPDDVDNVGVIKDAARLSFFGSRAGDGIIIINTKRGTVNLKETPGVIKYRPLGYLNPDEFYMPRYDLAEVKNQPEIDYRSTIYWNPDIVTDSNGQAKVSFYTADMNATYTITVEGMDKNGEVYHQVKTIQR